MDLADEHGGLRKGWVPLIGGGGTLGEWHLPKGHGAAFKGHPGCMAFWFRDEFYQTLYWHRGFTFLMLKVDNRLIQFLHKLQIPQSQISLLTCKPILCSQETVVTGCGLVRLLQEWSGTSVGRSSPGRDWESTRFQEGGQRQGARLGIAPSSVRSVPRTIPLHQ